MCFMLCCVLGEVSSVSSRSPSVGAVNGKCCHVPQRGRFLMRVIRMLGGERSTAAFSESQRWELVLPCVGD